MQSLIHSQKEGFNEETTAQAPERKLTHHHPFNRSTRGFLGGEKQEGQVHPTEQSPVSEGEELFKKNCNMCHFADKTDKKIAPGLKDLFKNKELPQSHKPATEANVREQIEKGSRVMPAFGNKLTPTEIDDLLEYLKTL